MNPAFPARAREPPVCGPGWIHEIKHDGFRILAELNTGRVRLGGLGKASDLTERFPAGRSCGRRVCPARSCIVDSESTACDANGLSVFDLLSYRRQDDAVTLCAFDLLELDGVDLRPEPIEISKRTLEGLLRRERRRHCLRVVADGDGAIILQTRLCARLRGHRIEAAGLTLSTGPAGLKDQGQKSCRATDASARRRKIGANVGSTLPASLDD